MNHAFNRALFIINKKSGTGYQSALEGKIIDVCKKHDIECTLEFTKARAHATELAQMGVNQKFDLVVAVGGDGTLNEVAQALVGTETVMGIIPKGSGNGLARHLGIPLQMGKAVDAILSSKKIKMDTFTLNGKLSINVSGIGFDGHIAKEFDTSSRRGLANYVRVTLKEFNQFKDFDMRIEVEGSEPLNRSGFIIAIANSSQYGNNARVAPMASVCDGKLQLCILKKVPLYRLDVAYRMFNGTLTKAKSFEILEASNIHITTSRPIFFHVDGEPQHETDSFEIKVNPGSLNMMAPGLLV